MHNLFVAPNRIETFQILQILCKSIPRKGFVPDSRISHLENLFVTVYPVLDVTKLSAPFHSVPQCHHMRRIS